MFACAELFIEILRPYTNGGRDAAFHKKRLASRRHPWRAQRVEGSIKGICGA